MTRYNWLPSSKIRHVVRAFEARGRNLWDRILDWEWPL